jgi:hypothetical protein
MPTNTATFPVLSLPKNFYPQKLIFEHDTTNFHSAMDAQSDEPVRGVVLICGQV